MGLLVLSEKHARENNFRGSPSIFSKNPAKGAPKIEKGGGKKVSRLGGTRKGSAGKKGKRRGLGVHFCLFYNPIMRLYKGEKEGGILKEPLFLEGQRCRGGTGKSPRISIGRGR